MSLLDSTGYALVDGDARIADLGDAHMALVVRGAALASRCQGNLSLLEPLLASGVAIGRFLDRRGLDADVNVRCVFINAAASVRNQKADKKFKEVRRFREDLALPQTTRSIRSYKTEFPSLYDGEDSLHFRPEVARPATIKILTDARDFAAERLYTDERDQYVLLVICASWNARRSPEIEREACASKMLVGQSSFADVLRMAAVFSQKSWTQIIATGWPGKIPCSYRLGMAP